MATLSFEQFKSKVLDQFSNWGEDEWMFTWSPLGQHYRADLVGDWNRIGISILYMHDVNRFSVSYSTTFRWGDTLEQAIEHTGKLNDPDFWWQVYSN